MSYAVKLLGQDRLLFGFRPCASPSLCYSLRTLQLSKFKENRSFVVLSLMLPPIFFVLLGHSCSNLPTSRGRRWWCKENDR